MAEPDITDEELGAEEEGDALEQPAKRQRIDDGEYPRGTVKKVRVRNFMTYGDEVTITPGPRLNLVLGPNGTGKSSLVCALCVGLAGSTKLLGRADHVKEYIKRDAQEGWVETTLSGGPGHRDWRVLRVMKKEGDGKYSSAWKINDVNKAEKDVKKLVADLNIQFDNLCQFLPQDKVTQFAQMDAYELLTATEKAIGDASLFNTHQQLITKREAAKQLEQTHAVLQKQLERARAAVKDLERDYERFQRRQELQAKIETCHAREAWLKVGTAQARFQEALAAAKEAADQYEALQAEAKVQEGPLRSIRTKMDAAHSGLQKVTENNRRLQQQVITANTAVEKAEEEADKVQSELEQLKTQSRSRLRAIEAARKKVTELEQQLAELPPAPDHNPQIQQLMESNKELQDQITNLGYEIQEQQNKDTQVRMHKSQVERQLQDLQNERHQRLDVMARIANAPGMVNVVQWVQQMKRDGQFKGEVYGPLGTELQLKDRKYASYLEKACGRRLSAWTCAYKEDESLITAKLKQERVWSPVLTTDVNRTPPPAEPGQFAELGVECSLDEVYDAPVLVKACLRNFCHLHRNLVVPDWEHQRVPAVLNLGATVCNRGQLLSRMNPAYGNNQADRTEQSVDVPPARVLGGATAGQLQEAAGRLQQQLATIEAELAQISSFIDEQQAARGPLQQQLQQQDATIHALRKEQADAIRERQGLNKKLVAHRKQLTTWEHKPDPMDTQPALIAQLQAAAKQRATGLTKLVTGLQQQWALTQQWMTLELTWKELEMQQSAIKAEQRELQQRLRDGKSAAERASKTMSDAKVAFKAAEALAKETYKLTAELKAAFQGLPNDLEEVAGLRAGYEEEVATIVTNNPRVAEEYQQKSAAAADLTTREAEAAGQLQLQSGEIETIKATWLPQLKEVVSKINESFSSNFSHIGCAGEVVLAEHADFDKFAMEVRVKFREDEPLQRLNPHRQSGGERSVSTILYLIALQGVTVTPFRVVDEINQGMDAINERKVFRHLVEAACAPGTPQCFLLTPKLLPDLPYTRDVTVLQIFNGPLVEAAMARGFSKADLFGARLQQAALAAA